MRREVIVKRGRRIERRYREHPVSAMAADSARQLFVKPIIA